jgi:hypothetical protein
MFEEFDPEQVLAPPPGAIGAAMTRGRRLRRQRRARVTSALTFCVILVGGIFLSNPLSGDDAVAPADLEPTVRDYAPILTVTGSEQPSLDFGTLSAVTQKDGVVTLTVDRSQVYGGAEAKARNGGKAPTNDYLYEDADGKKLLTFTLDPKATILGGYELTLRDDDNAGALIPMTVPELMRNLNTPDPESSQSPRKADIWMRHVGGPDGPVTSLAERFSP